MQVSAKWRPLVSERRTKHWSKQTAISTITVQSSRSQCTAQPHPYYRHGCHGHGCQWRRRLLSVHNWHVIGERFTARRRIATVWTFRVRPADTTRRPDTPCINWRHGQHIDYDWTQITRDTQYSCQTWKSCINHRTNRRYVTLDLCITSQTVEAGSQSSALWCTPHGPGLA